MKYLYRYETKGIQSWILNSKKLRDLVGGSALIEQLTQVARQAAEDEGAEVIQATSGAMTAVFPNKAKLEAFASEWPMQVAFRAPGLQLVQAWVEDQTEGLASLFEKLSAQRNASPLNGLELNSWVLRTGQTGLPAIPFTTRSAARGTALDLGTVAKELAKNAVTSRKDVHQSIDLLGGRSWEDFTDFDEWPEGPIAVVHADGSGIGKRLLQLKTHDEQKRFSQAMKEAGAAATAAAVATLATESGQLLARPVVAAGDDLTYLLPAKDARNFCRAWLETFERETRQRADALKGELYGGAGIIFVQKGYPFSRAYELAEQLCKTAKDQVKDRKWEKSVLAFKRVTNSLVEDVSKHSTAWIQRPHEPDALTSLVKTVRSLPRGPLRTWLDHFQRPGGENQATQLWQRMREVTEAKDKRLWEEFCENLRAVGADPTTGAYRDPQGNEVAIPLSGASNQATTPIADALTLRFLERPEREVSSAK